MYWSPHRVTLPVKKLRKWSVATEALSASCSLYLRIVKRRARFIYHYLQAALVAVLVPSTRFALLSACLRSTVHCSVDCKRCSQSLPWPGGQSAWKHRFAPFIVYTVLGFPFEDSQQEACHSCSRHTRLAGVLSERRSSAQTFAPQLRILL